jgi:murein DD-endopeptidase MepM/ murein hydrolase activator NlpD
MLCRGALLMAFAGLLAGGASGAVQAPVSIALNARSLQPGEVVVVTIIAPAETKGLKVSAFNRDVPMWRIDEQRWRGLIGIDMEAKPAKYRVTAQVDPSAAPPVQEAVDLEVAPKVFRTRRLKVNPAFVNPPKGARARIEADAKLLAHTWTVSAPERLWSAGFSRPVPHDANSVFGVLSIYNGEARTRHGGTDFLSPSGTPVAAPAAGRVLLAQDLYFTGNTVILDHGLGLFSLFAHLSAIDVADGAAVAAGAVVGKVGATGRVTGPHLHWTVRLNGARVDPLSLLASAPSGGAR